MGHSQTSSSLEYEQANEWWRQISQMRRQDLAAFTALEGAAVTIIGNRLLNFASQDWFLSIVAFCVVLIGFNNERRLNLFYQGIRARAEAIERANGMTLLTSSIKGADAASLVKTNTAFKFYYLLVASIWIFAWILNIRRLLHH